MVAGSGFSHLASNWHCNEVYDIFVSLQCWARGMWVIPPKADRSQSDVTHNRVFILFEEVWASSPPPPAPPSHRTIFGVGGALNVYPGKVL